MPNSLAVLLADRGLLAAGAQADTGRHCRVFMVDTTTGDATAVQLPAGVMICDAIVYGADGQLYVGTGHDGIFRIDPDTGALDAFARPFHPVPDVPP